MKTTKRKNDNKTFGTPKYNKDTLMARLKRAMNKRRAARKKKGLGRRTRYKILKGIKCSTAKT